MCNQTASLVARALEESGISTVTISLLREITEKVRPPRALEVPYGFGFPLGRANDVGLQHKILKAALDMLERVEVAGEIREFQED
jgi:hypothetical protein